MFFKRLFKKPKVKQETVFSGTVRKMDVRHGGFLWLQGPDTGGEFYGSFSITKVEVDLPDRLLMQKVEAKTETGLRKVKLKFVLDHISNRKKYFKFIKLRHPIHVRIVGEKDGDVEIFITDPKKKGKKKSK